MSGASTADPPGTTIIVGLGNPILGDDGAGWLVADVVEAAIAGEGRRGAGVADGRAFGRSITVVRLAVGGLTLMERLIGHRRAIVIDAVITGTDAPGSVRRRTLEDLPGREAGHADSSHDATLREALDAGRALGAVLPEELEIVTIEAASVLEISETMTPAVARAVPLAADLVLALLAR